MNQNVPACEVTTPVSSRGEGSGRGLRAAQVAVLGGGRGKGVCVWGGEFGGLLQGFKS